MSVTLPGVVWLWNNVWNRRRRDVKVFVVAVTAPLAALEMAELIERYKFGGGGSGGGKGSGMLSWSGSRSSSGSCSC